MKRQPDGEAGAAAQFGREGERPVMLPGDHIVTDRQPLSGAPADGLGGEEWLEDPRLGRFGDAGTGVPDLDLDHLEAISELLNDEAAGGTEIVPTTKSFRYDLCPNCHAKFVNDPLSRETTQKFDFSPN